MAQLRLKSSGFYKCVDHFKVGYTVILSKVEAR